MGQTRASLLLEYLKGALTTSKNEVVTVFPSAARTATEDSSDVTNEHGIGCVVIIDVTAASGTPSVVFKIQGKDPVSGKYYDILDSAAITGVETAVLRVWPAMAPSANAKEDDILPRTWRVRAEHADASSVTYSVGAVVA